MIEVQQAAVLVSPVYDDGKATEADVRQLYWERLTRLHGFDRQ